MTIRHHDDPDADGLYQAILERPHDLLVRRVYADRLDDIGEVERAEFIRLSCDPDYEFLYRDVGLFERLKAGWFPDLAETGVNLVLPWWGQLGSNVGVVRRGFVEEIRRPLAWWLGEKCRHCTDGRFGFPPPEERDCPACDRCRHTPGHGVEVVSRHPVTRVVTALAPWQHSPGQAFCWWRASAWDGRGDGENSVGNLPDEVFDRVAKDNPESRINGNGPPDNQHLAFPTREAAVEALSIALVNLARERAGLPKLEWEVPA